MDSKWTEIKCDYLCEDSDDMFWRVDAWLTNDEWEEGKVIAYIDDLTGRVVYADPDARWDAYALDVIADKQAEIKRRLSEESPKAPQYAVAFTYSFDSDAAAYLFPTQEEALAFLKRSFEEELRIDETEVMHPVEGKISDDGCYAAIAVRTAAGVDTTEFHLASIYT